MNDGDFSHHLAITESFSVESICHVVWDWNGTLLDDAWLCVEAMNQLLAEYQLAPLTNSRYASLFGFPVNAYYRRLGFDFSRESFEAIGAKFIELYQSRQHECFLQSGTRKALALLAEKKISCSVLSASEQHRLNEQVTRLGLDGYFTYCLGLNDCYAGSKLEQGRRLLAQLSLNPRQVLFIGDTDHDHEVANALGAPCVLIPSGHQSLERLMALRTPVTSSLDALFNSD